MTQAELYTLLKTSDLPVAYRAFRKAQKPPYICYIFSDSQDFLADNINYSPVGMFDVELYTVEKDPTTEAALEKIFNDNRLPYDKTEAFIESENMLKVTYTIGVNNG